ncbi:MAG: HNH endonuclease [Kiritimatiellaeota bacterium]|nr:HNH endonuclease [Kiritimatiellota bacterium]
MPLNPDRAHVARERRKARELRASNWWKALLQRGECHYCRKKFPPSALTMDHVIPLSRGGASTRGNIVPACENCNKSKRHLTPAERILRELEEGGALDENQEYPTGENEE